MIAYPCVCACVGVNYITISTRMFSFRPSDDINYEYFVGHSETAVLYKKVCRVFHVKKKKIKCLKVSFIDAIWTKLVPTPIRTVTWGETRPIPTLGYRRISKDDQKISWVFVVCG